MTDPSPSPDGPPPTAPANAPPVLRRRRREWDSWANLYVAIVVAMLVIALAAVGVVVLVVRSQPTPGRVAPENRPAPMQGPPRPAGL